MARVRMRWRTLLIRHRERAASRCRGRRCRWQRWNAAACGRQLDLLPCEPEWTLGAEPEGVSGVGNPEEQCNRANDVLRIGGRVDEREGGES
eukprot:scaffold98949_cov32-Tisochrysis_lutea.AAC.9